MHKSIAMVSKDYPIKTQLHALSMHFTSNKSLHEQNYGNNLWFMKRFFFVLLNILQTLLWRDELKSDLRRECLLPQHKSDLIYADKVTRFFKEIFESLIAFFPVNWIISISNFFNPINFTLLRVKKRSEILS